MQWIQYVFNLKTFTLKKEVVEKRLWLYKYAHAADWLKFLLRFISNSWGGVTNQMCNSSFVLLKLSVCGAWGCFNDWNVRGCAVLCCAAQRTLVFCGKELDVPASRPPPTGRIWRMNRHGRWAVSDMNPLPLQLPTTSYYPHYSLIAC